MDEDDGATSVATTRSKVYVIASAAGIGAAILGIWLAPVSAEIGRREIGASYMAGEFLMLAGCIVALLSIVLAIVDN